MKPGLPHFAKHLILMGFSEIRGDRGRWLVDLRAAVPRLHICWRIRLSGPDAVGVA